MVSKDVGRLLVLSAFVALCAIVLFSSEVDAKGYGDVTQYKGSVKRVVKGERRGHAYGLKNRKHGFFGKFGRRGSKENFGRGLGKRHRGGRRGRGYNLRKGKRGYGRNLRKSLRNYKGGKRGRGRGYGRRFGGKRRGKKYRGKKNKGSKGKKYRGKSKKGYPKKKDENC
nr:bcl-2-associated transcription factor 1-like [Crassostrea gigas]